MLVLIVVVCILGIFYAYFGYPICLMLLTPISRDEELSQDEDSPNLEENAEPPSISLIIAAKNEEGFIADKLANTLSLQYPTPVQVLVASDNSSDATEEIVLSFADRGVVLVPSRNESGKEFAQKCALGQAEGEVIVFTDAKTHLSEEALINFAAWFEDRSIGAVSSTDRLVQSSQSESGESAYVAYEMWLRQLESNFGSLVGLSGSCFAVRRSLCRNFRTDMPSDFSLLIEAKRNGLRGVLAPDVLCSYHSVKTAEEEFDRKVRTVLRGITTFLSCKEVMNPFRFGSFSWQIISHKLFRWLVPFFLIVAGLGTLLLASPFWQFRFLLFLGVLFIAMALFALGLPQLQEKSAFRIPMFFIVTNTAILAAWWKYLRGDRQMAWEPSER